MVVAQLRYHARACALLMISVARVCSFALTSSCSFAVTSPCLVRHVGRAHRLPIRSGLHTLKCSSTKASKVKNAKKATGGKVDLSNHISVDLSFPGLKVVNVDPPVFCIDRFFDDSSCETYANLGVTGESTGDSIKINSATFGGSLTGSNRQSTTWFVKYSKCETLIKKALALLPEISVEQMEEPQIVRYEMGDFFNWHEDAVPKEEAANGGQRLATLLVYLNDVSASGGGMTTFKELDVKVRPEKGKALLFFPAFKDGTPDPRTLHAGSPAFDTKWIAQVHPDRDG